QIEPPAVECVDRLLHLDLGAEPLELGHDPCADRVVARSAGNAGTGLDLVHDPLERTASVDALDPVLAAGRERDRGDEREHSRPRHDQNMNRADISTRMLRWTICR